MRGAKPFPKTRKGTYVFLRDARRTSPVYLLAEVDATSIQAARAASGGKISYIGFVVKAAADAIAAVPDARSLLTGISRKRLAVVDDVHAKVLFDKTVDGQRCVAAGTVAAVQNRSVLEVQEEIDAYKDAEVADPQGPYRRQHQLARLPLWLFGIIYRAALRAPERRTAIQGTFAVTSVGREEVRGILPLISGTLGFGMGRIRDTPVVRGGEVSVAPILTLSLTFDHRVIDGAQAAEILAEVKKRLETWRSP